MALLQQFCLGESISLPSQAVIKGLPEMDRRPSSGPSPPVGLSSQLRDLVRDRKCSCLPEMRVQRNVICFTHTRCLP